LPACVNGERQAKRQSRKLRPLKTWNETHTSFFIFFVIIPAAK
jgi:hypothetical protein